MSAECFARAAVVSRETTARLAAHLALLAAWNERMNLVSAAGLEDPWRRHMLDSAQLARFLPPSADRVVDLGSGAGFPGLVLALVAEGRGIAVDLIESNRRKAAFLEAAVRETGAPARVHCARIESRPVPPAPVATARACAPLDRLLGHARPLVAPGGLALFSKGRRVDAELATARRGWRLAFSRHPSASDPGGAILAIDSFERIGKRAGAP